MDLQDLYRVFVQCKGIVTDSRIKNNGALFVALRGESFNGNDFAQTALDNGCAFALVDEIKYEGKPGYIVVESTLSSLQELARFHRKKLGITIIGVTGTNGKTTTKELIFAILSKKKKAIATKGNLNNHIGVPMTLLSMGKEHEIAIVEMGANHCNEIAELCAIAEPDYGIISSIGKAHLEGFGTFENIIKTKAELYKSVQANNGLLFVNGDNDLLLSLSENCNRILYGSDVKCQTRGAIVDSNPLVRMTIAGDNVEISTKLVGAYNFDNLMASVCVGLYFGVDIYTIKEALESYTPDNNRSQMKTTERNTLLLDAYNANPSSMKASLNNFGLMVVENKMVILGEMLELGIDSTIEHQAIYKFACQQDFKAILLVGTWDVPLSHNTLLFPSTELLIEYLQNNIIAESTVLIKGSRGNRLERVVDYL